VHETLCPKPGVACGNNKKAIICGAEKMRFGAFFPSE
jgi:hypothetical protein